MVLFVKRMFLSEQGFSVYPKRLFCRLRRRAERKGGEDTSGASRWASCPPAPPACPVITGQAKSPVSANEEKMCYSRFAVLASLRSRRGCRRSYRQPGGKHNLDFFLDRMCSFNLFYNECNSSFSNLFKWLGNTGQRWI